MEARPNILLIVIDCGRSDRWIGQGRRTVTPNLDRLRAGGVTFPTTITEKSCTSPNFSSLLTGLYSPHHGVQYVFGCRLPADVPMLTHRLAAGGYTTYAEATGPLTEAVGLGRGFDHYEFRALFDYLDTGWGEMFLRRLQSGYYKPPWFLMLHLWELHWQRRVLPACDSPAFGADTYERAVSSLDTQLGRVFAAVGDDTLTVITADHGEATGEDEYLPGTAVDYTCRILNMDKARGMPLDSVGWLAGFGTLQAFEQDLHERLKGMRLGDGLPEVTFGRWDRWMDRLRLLWMVPFVWMHDLFALRAPVRLTAMLKRRGLLDADAGRRRLRRMVRFVGREKVLQMQMRMWVNSYRQMLHEGHTIAVYDFLTKVPLVMHWPGRLPAGKTIDRMVRQVDILPTILDLVGIDGRPAAPIEGQSLRPLIEDSPWQARPVFQSVSGGVLDFEVHGVRTEEFRYTYGPHNPDLPQELYDLRADPRERTNLAAGQPALCERLRQLTASFVPEGGGTASDLIEIRPHEQRQIEKHLQELGYIE